MRIDRKHPANRRLGLLALVVILALSVSARRDRPRPTS